MKSDESNSTFLKTAYFVTKYGLILAQIKGMPGKEWARMGKHITKLSLNPLIPMPLPPPSQSAWGGGRGF